MMCRCKVCGVVFDDTTDEPVDPVEIAYTAVYEWSMCNDCIEDDDPYLWGDDMY